MKILVFGNPLVQEDSLAIKVSEKLKKLLPGVEFKEFDSAENLEEEGKNLLILDVAKGIDRVQIINGVENYQSGNIYSLHDFDLAMTLKLLKKMKKIDSVCVIAIPFDYSFAKAFKETENAILKLKANL